MSIFSLRRFLLSKRPQPAVLLALCGGTGLLTLSAVNGFAADEAASGKVSATPEQTTFFESKIRPLLISKCYSCHSEGDAQGGIRLDGREFILKGNAHGPAILTADPEKSPLLKVVHYNGAIQMPPGGKLKPIEIAALTAWVKMGAPWPESGKAGEKGSAAEGKSSYGDYTITPEQKAFWAFVPPKRVAPPTVKNIAWAKSPIDRFILARLEAKGLHPAPQADRRTLIRRAYFDLIGLPPTPEQVEAFVSDKAPNAWAKVIDGLLANPHYGERWGRHWLDVVRYADSNGLDENLAFANAYRYRDYVVDALNKDKPYSDFVTEQLAGDLLPTADPHLRNERLTATGFLTLGPKVLAEQDKPKLVMDIVDEQIEVSSKAFLGLTVACARCHNHKFDPIPTKDYYALAGIFKSTKTMKDLGFVSNWNERALPTPELEAQIKASDAQIKTLSDGVNMARNKANAELLAKFKQDEGRYLLAGWELAQNPATELGSLADLPVRPGYPLRLTIEAEKFDRGNALRDTNTYGAGIGVIHTGTPPTFAEWDINLPSAGTYQVELRYTAMESRPMRLLVNGKVVRGDAAGSVTGSWNPDGQKWEPQGVYAFTAGRNTIRIECDGAIPHIDKLLIAAQPALKVRPGALPARTAEAIAAQRNLNVAVLKNTARFLRGLLDSDDTQKLLQTAGQATSEPEFAARAAQLVPQLDAASQPELVALRKTVNAPNGLFALPPKPETFYSEKAKADLKTAEDALKTAQANAPKMPMAMAVEEDKPEDVRIHIRGNTETLGDVAPRRFLVVVAGEKQAPIPTGHSGRLELAQWLTRPDHPLTARVEINRIWQEHFGEGLVRTPDNFGLRGEKPSHPELLDWLATEFVRNGWSLKKMHRLIMLSSAYQMSAANDSKALLTDPDNRLLWRMNRRRLEAEPFRDSLLAVSGKLDASLGGSLLSTPDYGYVTNDQSGNAGQYSAPRRSLYLPIIRNAMFDMFQAFDVGDPSMVNAHRATTTVASQALYVMNSPFVIEQSKAFADNLLAMNGADDTKRIRVAYRKALERSPSPVETERATSFLKRYDTALTNMEPDATKRRAKSWQALCQILFASNEFIYVD